MATAHEFETRASQRHKAMDRYFWTDSKGAFFDWDWTKGTARLGLSAAAIVPLFTGTASQHQADALAATARRRLLAPGGFATTEIDTGEQWDRPTGWAPLQWMAVNGFSDYSHTDLAATIRERWLRTVRGVYEHEHEGKLVEKYAIRPTGPTPAEGGGGGGEYPLQDGFGWSNGIAWRWLPFDDLPMPSKT